MLGTGRFRESIEWCTRGIELEEDYQRREPLVMESNSTLSSLCSQRALAYGLEGEEAKAAADWSRAAAVAEKAPDVQARLAGALALAHLGNCERATSRIGAACPVDQLFQHALVNAACAAAAVRDERAATSEQPGRVRQYADEALKLLEQARAAGMLRNPAHQRLLREAPGFAALRHRPEFERLLRGLQETSPLSP
jgi:hypothetical protein